jgi:hypothetical protein
MVEEEVLVFVAVNCSFNAFVHFVALLYYDLWNLPHSVKSARSDSGLSTSSGWLIRSCPNTKNGDAEKL